MLHRVTRGLMALAALASLALGAGAIANAQTAHHAKKAATVHHRAVARTSQATPSQTTPGSTSTDPAGPNDQADTPGSTNEQPGTETPDGSEPAGSEVAGNDGPGGHADEPGNPNADHQATGEE